MPIVRIADQPATAWRPGQTLRQAIGAAQGSTSLSMQHFTVEPGAETPLHFHDVDEALLPLSGRIDVYVDNAWHSVGPGEVCVFLAGCPHGFTGAGDGTRRDSDRVPGARRPYGRAHHLPCGRAADSLVQDLAGPRAGDSPHKTDVQPFVGPRVKFAYPRYRLLHFDRERE